MNFIWSLMAMFIGINIQVVNCSSVPVENLQVRVIDESFEIKNIQPGSNYSWRFKPKKDGSFNVNGYFVNGRSIHGQSLGYTTVNDFFDHQLVIHEGGNVTYRVMGLK